MLGLFSLMSVIVEYLFSEEETVLVEDVLRAVNSADPPEGNYVGLIIDSLEQEYPDKQELEQAIEHEQLAEFVFCILNLRNSDYNLATKSAVFFILRYIGEGWSLRKVISYVLFDIVFLQDSCSEMEQNEVLDALTMRFDTSTKFDSLELSSLDLPESTTELEEDLDRDHFDFVNYIMSEMTEPAFARMRSTTKRLINQRYISPQHFYFPIIKGPSGAGKTRLGYELSITSIRMLQKSGQKGIFLMRCMRQLPGLRSAFFTNTQRRVNGKCFMIATLLTLLQGGVMPNDEVLRGLMCGDTKFTLDQFMSRLKKDLGIDTIFLQIDEYREDLQGTLALMQTCAQTLELNRDKFTRVYPIVTGMTSYVELNDQETNRHSTVSDVTGAKQIHLSGFSAYPEAKERLERQFALHVFYEFEGNIPQQDPTEIEDIILGDGHLVRNLLDEIDGHPRFYTFLSDSILERGKIAHKVVNGQLDLAGARELRKDMLNLLGSIFKDATWRSQVHSALNLPPASTCTYTTVDDYVEHTNLEIVKNVSIGAMKHLLALAITRQPVRNSSDPWTFGNVWLKDFPLNMSLEAAQHSGLFALEADEQNLYVHMSPIIIAALNMWANVVYSASLSCLPRNEEEMAYIAADSFRLRMCAKEAVTRSGSIYLSEIRSHVKTRGNISPRSDYFRLCSRHLSLWRPVGFEFRGSNRPGTGVYNVGYDATRTRGYGTVCFADPSTLPYSVIFANDSSLPKKAPVDALHVFSRFHLFNIDAEVDLESESEENGDLEDIAPTLNRDELIFVFTLVSRPDESINHMAARLALMWKYKLMQSLESSNTPYTVFVDIVLVKWPTSSGEVTAYPRGIEDSVSDLMFRVSSSISAVAVSVTANEGFSTLFHK